MEFPRMVYRLGSMVELEGARYDWAIANADDFAQMEREGWRLDIYAAKEAKHEIEEVKEAQEVLTRASLESKAKAKGIKFDGRTSDKKLAALVESHVD